MKVLITHEKSQVVCQAFRGRGHEAYSNDIQPCSGGHPEWHLQMDCYEAIDLMDWDFIGMHPVCTKMTLSGNRWYGAGKDKHDERLLAVEDTIKLWNYACEKAKRGYMENPLGAMNGDIRLPKPQIIQPFYFGDGERKTTCLWLHNLPPLYHNKDVNLFDKNITHVPINYYTTSSGIKYTNVHNGCGYGWNTPECKEARSITFPGIAKAMANQWGIYG